jgi:hypothetical protein
MNGDYYNDLAENNISGCWKWFYNYQKAFDNYILASKAYNKENNFIKCMQANKNACYIYEMHFDEKQKTHYKNDYDSIVKVSLNFSKILLPQTNSISYKNYIQQTNSFWEDDEDIK